MTIKIKHIQDISEGLIMRYKRIRGSKRKFRNIECLLSEATRQFNIAVPKHFEAVAYKETISDELLFVREFERMA